jgi:hypothetical protein
MVEHGEISLSEAASHPSRAALTSYLGKAEVDEYDLPSDPPLTLKPGDKVLLASDGLFGFITEAEIARHLAKDPQHAAEALVHATIDQQKPYQDNVTVAILGYELPPPIPLADTQIRKTEPALTVAEKPHKKKNSGMIFKVAMLLTILAVAAFWGGRYFFESTATFPAPAKVTDKPDSGKPVDKLPEQPIVKPVQKAEEKPLEKPADKPLDKKEASTDPRPNPPGTR